MSCASYSKRNVTVCGCESLPQDAMFPRLGIRAVSQLSSISSQLRDVTGFISHQVIPNGCFGKRLNVKHTSKIITKNRQVSAPKPETCALSLKGRPHLPLRCALSRVP